MDWFLYDRDLRHERVNSRSRRSKKRLCRRCFPVDFAKFLRTPFIIEHLCRLLKLIIGYKPILIVESVEMSTAGQIPHESQQ